MTVTLPALVYGYELIASIKEISSLPLILALGALVVLHPRWLRGPPRGAIPFALVAAAGVSALGVAFGAWALTAVVVLVAIAAPGRRRRETARPIGRAHAPAAARGAGLLVAFVAALGTWLELSGSLQVARNIASTNNPGNLQNPLRTVQILGTWLVSSYKHVPAGGDLTPPTRCRYLALVAAVLGAAYVVYRREYALAAWIALTLAVWLGLTAYGTTWADGKALMLTSPVVVLLAWGGVAALRDCARSRSGASDRCSRRRRSCWRSRSPAASPPPTRSSTTAPTSRRPRATKSSPRSTRASPAGVRRCSPTTTNTRSMSSATSTSAAPASCIRRPRSRRPRAGRRTSTWISPAALRSYPLIVTRRDPAASRPPAAYRLLCQGAYYEVWGRLPGAPAALAHVAPARDNGGGDEDRGDGGRRVSDPMLDRLRFGAAGQGAWRTARQRAPAARSFRSTWRARCTPRGRSHGTDC